MAEQDHILTVHNMCTLEADDFGDRIIITCA
jgi:hypothetical protein